MIRVTGKSTRGRSHKNKGLPNQDAIKWLFDNERKYLILAVSDGHGSKKSFFSNLGSEFAVEVACEEALKLALTMEDKPLNTLSEDDEKLFRNRLIEQWKIKVNRHLEENPDLFNISLNKIDSDDDSVFESINVLQAYGATLILALVTESYCHLWQLGDGDIILTENMNKPFRPLPPDDRLFANQTTSLCIENAWKDFRYKAVELPASQNTLLMLSTDGYCNSFENDDGFLQVASDIQDIIQENGFSYLEENLESWLTEASASGSGDDVTAAFIFCNPDDSLPEFTIEQKLPPFPEN